VIGIPATEFETYRLPLCVVGAHHVLGIPADPLLKLPSATVSPATTPGGEARADHAAFGRRLRFAYSDQDILPKAVLNFIADANDIGDHMTKHPTSQDLLSRIARTGQNVMASAADAERITLRAAATTPASVLDASIRRRFSARHLRSRGPESGHLPPHQALCA